ncbi:MAG TPA: FAD-dependent monooxygenase [Nocardioidaceae bacterium]|nr:FAD-dependent monooxygenase [Nocardioidaceae bacterium]
MTDVGLRVAVSGGSLGGLTVGLLLSDAGFDVDVYERSRTKLHSRGAGIVLHDLTVRYLLEHELLDLDDVSVPATWWCYVDSAGEVIHRERCRHRFTSWNTLYHALHDHIRPQRYHLGREVTGFAQDDGAVRVGFADGSETNCDLLVCADGAASSARASLLPDAVARYAGYTGWRGTAEESDLRPATLEQLADTITYHVMPGSHILTYPIPGPEGQREIGHRLMNFVWYRNVADGPDLEGLMTDREGIYRPFSVPPGMLRDRYVDDLRAAAQVLPPALADVVRTTAEPFVQGIFDVAVDRMAFGRVCLLGDAAFCARPHAAAGTAKAAADAWALAAAMREHPDDPVAALRAWAPRQLEVGRNLVGRSREMGERSQFRCTWEPGDPSLAFGLYGPGD